MNNSFLPAAPTGKTFLVKAGKDAPDTVVANEAQVGSKPIQVSLTPVAPTASSEPCHLAIVLE